MAGKTNKTDNLNDKQRRFVEEYLVDYNAMQAAIRAAYNPATAGATACELLKNPKIQPHIAKALAARSKRTGITADRVLHELAKIGFANLDDVIDVDTGEVWKDAKRDDMAAIATIKVRRIPTPHGEVVEREVKMCDKTRALLELGRHVGILDAKVKVDMATPVSIVDNLTE